jgi:hypothetical protein
MELGGRWVMDVFRPEDSVGRKSRRAVGWFSPPFCRAGSEPRRGRPTDPRFEAAETDNALGDSTRTHGSNPARLRHGGSNRRPRRDFRPTSVSPQTPKHRA